MKILHKLFPKYEKKKLIWSTKIYVTEVREDVSFEVYKTFNFLEGKRYKVTLDGNEWYGHSKAEVIRSALLYIVKRSVAYDRLYQNYAMDDIIKTHINHARR